jgi:hypothetical protein
MDPSGAVDPMALTVVLIGYALAGFLWLTLALRTNRRG